MKSYRASQHSARLVLGMLAILCIASALLLVTRPVQAKTFPVLSFEDSPDTNPGDGDCISATVPGGLCTLRAAIQEANASTSTADIIFLPAGIYTLTVSGIDEDEAKTGDLDITSNLVISGSGAASTTIQGKTNWDDRIFHILGNGVAVINSVTISGGNLADDAGAGILLYGDDPDDDVTGGTLQLNLCRITNNRSTAFGGGISSSGILNISRCTIDNNRTTGDAAARGGGIFSNAGATLTMYNSTVSGNTAQNRGGGVDISNDGRPSTLNNVTIANNNLLDLDGDDPDGAGLYVGNTRADIYNSLLAGNKTGSGSGNDCDGGIFSLKFSLIQLQPEGCNFIAENSSDNQTGVNPNLGPLADNGGPTWTHALLANSPAINAGNPATKEPATNVEACYPIDQRGEVRSGRCDIGAFEVREQVSLFMPLLAHE